MKLLDTIQKDVVRRDLLAGSHEQAIQQLIRVLVERGKLPAADEERAVLALLKREALARTNIGNGVACPHAKVPFVKDFLGALGVLRDGIQYSGEGTPVQVVFLFLSPEWDATGHLALMSVVAALAKDVRFLFRLTKSRNEEEVIAHLRSALDALFGPGSE
ncbi:MAG: PTS sugar transporter subunit IIA [Planctomycetes bacterium]|nr:PTS sugar transporter subunit IIA [Planctomycetota bacterium]